MPDNFMGVTETVATSLDVVSAMVQEELRNNAVLFNAVTDYTSLVVKGANTVKIPRGTALTAGTKSEGTASEIQAITWATDDLELSAHKHIVVRLEHIANEQSVVDNEAEIVTAMSKAMVQSYEDVIFTELAKASSSAPDHKIDSDGYVLAEVDILEAKRLLDVQNAPLSDRFMLIHPTQLKEVLAIANFIQQDRYAGNQAIMNGEVGMVYGFKVLVSTTCTENKAYFWQKGHVAFARQVDVEFKSAEAPLIYAATDYSVRALSGSKVLRAGVLGVEVTIR
jgi:N4-gp56 family major capsid protein